MIQVVRPNRRCQCCSPPSQILKSCTGGPAKPVRRSLIATRIAAWKADRPQPVTLPPRRSAAVPDREADRALEAGESRTWGAPGATQTTPSELRESYQALASNPAEIRSMIDAQYTMLPPTHREVVACFITRIISVPEFRDFIYENIAPLIQSGSEIDFKKYAAELGLSLQVKGMTRLSSDKQLSFEKYSLRMKDWLRFESAEVCKTIVVSSSLPAAFYRRVELEYLSQISASEARAIFDVYFESASAELRDFPLRRSVTSDQALFGNEAYEAILLNLVDSTSDPESLYEAAENMEGAPAEDVCDATRLSFEAILLMKGPTQAWFAQTFLESLH